MNNTQYYIVKTQVSFIYFYISEFVLLINKPLWKRLYKNYINDWQKYNKN